MILIFALIIACAFFTQSLIGFGSGLIAVPMLSLFMPVQDAVTIIAILQLSMGLLIYYNKHNIIWPHVVSLIPGMVIGVVIGIFALKHIDGNTMRLVLAGYIVLHLLRTHAGFDPFKKAMEISGAHIAGGIGGMLNAMTGGGGPAFIPYLRSKMPTQSQFRANINTILVISNIPRVIGAYGTGMMNADTIMWTLYGIPSFLIALFFGQKLHDKIPPKVFFIIIDAVLICTIAALLLKVAL